MTQPIDNTVNPSYYSRISPYQNISLEQSLLQNRTADIAITTAEGDIVTLSGASTRAEASSFNKIYDQVGSQQSFTTQQLTAESLSISIKGDLSAEELDDIGALVGDLQKVAHSFFQGDLGSAMDHALKIGDLGSLSGFSADFRYSMAGKTQLTESHPIPANLDKALAEQFPPPNEVPSAQGQSEVTYSDQLRAQWEQIKKYLDEKLAAIPAAKMQPPATQASVAPAPVVDTPPASAAAQQMMDRIRETVAIHPRLSPFIEPLVDRAIAGAGKNGSELAADKKTALQGRQLHAKLQERFQDWLYHS